MPARCSTGALRTVSSAIEKDAADFFRTFPDLRVEVINIFEKGDRAAGEIKMTGTNNGPAWASHRRRRKRSPRDSRLELKRGEATSPATSGNPASALIG